MRLFIYPHRYAGRGQHFTASYIVKGMRTIMPKRTNTTIVKSCRSVLAERWRRPLLVMIEIICLCVCPHYVLLLNGSTNRAEILNTFLYYLDIFYYLDILDIWIL